ncbi:MAG: GNAT family N-acetyltransferase [Nitrospirota bacterium]
MFIEPDGYLSLIYVRPSARRMGYGNMMIKAAKTVFPNLYAFPESDAGKSLMSRHGIPTSLCGYFSHRKIKNSAS